MSDREALQQRIRALFLGELDDAVRLLNEHLLGFEAVAGTEAGDALVRDMFRVAHGVKGAAHAAGAPDAAHAAHLLEERFATLRDGGAVLDDHLLGELLAHVDALAASRVALHGAEPPPSPPAPAAAPAPAQLLPTPPPPAGAPAVAPGPAQATVRVSAAKLDELLERTHDLAAAVGRVTTAVQATGVGAGPRTTEQRLAQQAARELSRLGAEVDSAVVALTFQSFAEVGGGLDRVVHDLADRAGKRVRFETTGEAAEVDRAVGAALREPLLHLLRNAVDHGIEAPAERVAVGKAEVGRIRVTVTPLAGRLEVEVSDDGRGIDRAAVRRVAAERGLADAEEEELVFAAGLTTAAMVSDVSGRGVGLDAIRARLQAMGGVVRLRSEPGQGTVVTIVSPLTLARARVLTVRAGGELVCLPLTTIQQVVRRDPDDVCDVDGVPTVVIDGRAIPVVALAAGADLGPATGLPPGPLQLALVDVGTSRVALAVDELVGEADVVVRGRPTRLAGLEAVLGTATLPDGRNALVLNVADCVAHGLADARRGLTVDDDRATTRRPQVLVVDDTTTTRTLEAGILDAAGYQVLVAADGAEAWDLLQLHGADLVLSDVDMPVVDGIELCRMIRASDRHAELPVVLLTSLGSDQDRRRGLEAGASAYLVKSEFDHETLLDVVARCL